MIGVLLNPRSWILPANTAKDRGLAYPWLPGEQYPLSDRHSILPGDPLLEHLDAALVKLAIRDYEQLCELCHESMSLSHLVGRSSDPIRTWRNNMGRFVGRERLSIGSLRLKRHCNREVNLDDEGNVDNTRTDEVMLWIRSRISDWKEANTVRTGRLHCPYWEADSIIDV